MPWVDYYHQNPDFSREELALLLSIYIYGEEHEWNFSGLPSNPGQKKKVLMENAFPEDHLLFSQGNRLWPNAHRVTKEDAAKLLKGVNPYEKWNHPVINEEADLPEIGNWRLPKPFKVSHPNQKPPDFLTPSKLYDLAHIYSYGIKNDWDLSKLPSDPKERIRFLHAEGKPVHASSIFDNIEDITEEDVQSILQGKNPWVSQGNRIINRNFMKYNSEMFAPRTPYSSGRYPDETPDEAELRKMSRGEGQGLVGTVGTALGAYFAPAAPLGAALYKYDKAKQKRHKQQTKSREDNLAELRAQPAYSRERIRHRKTIREAVEKLGPRTLRTVLASDNPSEAMVKRLGPGMGPAGIIHQVGKEVTPGYWEVPGVGKYAKESWSPQEWAAVLATGVLAPAAQAGKWGMDVWDVGAKGFHQLTGADLLNLPEGLKPELVMGGAGSEEDLTLPEYSDERDKLISALAMAEEAEYLLTALIQKQNQIKRTTGLFTAGRINEEQMHKRNMKVLFPDYKPPKADPKYAPPEKKKPPMAIPTSESVAKDSKSLSPPSPPATTLPPEAPAPKSPEQTFKNVYRDPFTFELTEVEEDESGQ